MSSFDVIDLLFADSDHESEFAFETAQPIIYSNKHMTDLG